MNNNENINRLIEDALSSVDDIKRAEVKPYLLTRINAKIAKVTESGWEKAGRFIARPAVAFTGLCMILFINAMVLFNSQSASPVATDQVAQRTPVDEFSYTVATIYDFDNTQP